MCKRSLHVHCGQAPGLAVETVIPVGGAFVRMSCLLADIVDVDVPGVNQRGNISSAYGMHSALGNPCPAAVAADTLVKHGGRHSPFLCQEDVAAVTSLRRFPGLLSSGR